jgi:hypothetical protein
MNNKKIKIVGIMLCMLILGTLIPAVATAKTQDPQIDSTYKYSVAMVMGKLTNVHKIGRIVIAQAVRLHYMGIGMDKDIDMGVIRNHLVIFHETPRFHLMAFGMHTMVLGNVLRLRIL